MKALNHFTVIELNNTEAPMIGTIPNVKDTENSKNIFKLRLVDALGNHFDNDDIHFTTPLPDFFDGDVYYDLNVSVDNNHYQIRVLRTWIY